MSNDILRRHAEELRRDAAETLERAEQSPDDWLLRSVAQSQQRAAMEAARQLVIAEVGESNDALEWRLAGQRLKAGEVPLSLLARLAEPLNKLLLRAAYFARNKLEPQQGGVGEDLTNELDLRLLGVAPGSARLFISGNTGIDTTGNSALKEAVEHLFETLEAAGALSTGKLSTDAAKELYLKLLDDADTRTAGLPLSGSGGNVGRTGAQARGSAP
jgi:hypothetical protein